MKNTLLTLFLGLSFNFIFAQAPVTISSSCETLGYHGTYTYFTNQSNTVNFYKKGTSWYDQNESQCAGDFPIDFYSIQKEGTQWVIRHDVGTGGSLFEYFLGECVPKFGTGAPSGTLIATNPANTTQPPCNGWIFTNPPTCTPTITGDCTFLSTDGFAFQNRIEIYPNPVENDFNIKFKEINDTIEITILNSLGQNIYSNNYSNTTEAKINLSNQATGVYFLKARNSTNQIAYFKLIKK